ncbi:hypothetical protein GH714_026942 [Hevea brasiliensis]|uniref:ATP-grasp domain-containing protein n=1 Tax=Hevea brasiliensis TaxID=3981 RepID=A0A6A6L2J2_HEVBR|nr:hypothetical protein GH714_026942 [Hevea brasiliensis]
MWVGESEHRLFEKHAIKNVVAEDGLEIDWEGEIDDNWVKEINCLEWESFAFHPSPLIVLVFERYNRATDNWKTLKELEKAVKTVKIDINIEKDLAYALKVKECPQILFLRGNRIIYREREFRTADQLLKVDYTKQESLTSVLSAGTVKTIKLARRNAAPITGEAVDSAPAALKPAYGADLMSKYGINVPKGVAVSSVDEVRKAIQEVFPNESELVVKSQILAGGRGLGKFKNGFEGGVHIVKAYKVEETAGKMLGQILVTKQTGPQGKVVSKVYLCEKLSLVNEMYFAIMLDRQTAGPLIIACKKGGTSIEDLAEKFPDLIIKVPIDVFKGITDEDAAKVVDGLAPKINPIAETSDNQLVAADAKLNFDDNAAFRRKEIFNLRDPTQEDPREVAAAKADLNYIGLDGEIGCMVNGAGLAMATMDIINCMAELLPIFLMVTPIAVGSTLPSHTYKFLASQLSPSSTALLPLWLPSCNYSFDVQKRAWSSAPPSILAHQVAVLAYFTILSLKSCPETHGDNTAYEAGPSAGFSIMAQTWEDSETTL